MKKKWGLLIVAVCEIQLMNASVHQDSVRVFLHAGKTTDLNRTDLDLLVKKSPMISRIVKDEEKWLPEIASINLAELNQKELGQILSFLKDQKSFDQYLTTSGIYQLKNMLKSLSYLSIESLGAQTAKKIKELEELIEPNAINIKLNDGTLHLPLTEKDKIEKLIRISGTLKNMNEDVAWTINLPLPISQVSRNVFLRILRLIDYLPTEQNEKDSKSLLEQLKKQLANKNVIESPLVLAMMIKAANFLEISSLLEPCIQELSQRLLSNEQLHEFMTGRRWDLFLGLPKEQAQGVAAGLVLSNKLLLPSIHAPTKAHELRGHEEEVDSIKWDPQSKKIATASWDTTVRLWTDDGKALVTIASPTQMVAEAVTWFSDSKKIVVSYRDGTISIFDSLNGKELTKIQGHDQPVSRIAVSPDGSKIASASWDGTAKIWDAQSGELIKTLKGHTDTVSSLDWSSSGKELITGSFDKKLIIWLVESGKPRAILAGHTDRVHAVAWSKDDMIASAGDDKKIILWNASTGKKVKEIEGHAGSIRSLAWHPENNQLASASFDKTVRVWHAPSGKHLYNLPVGDAAVYAVDWDAHGTRLATAFANGAATVWQIMPKKLSVPLTIDQMLFMDKAVDAYCGEKELKMNDHFTSIFNTLPNGYKELVTKKWGVKIPPKNFKK